MSDLRKAAEMALEFVEWLCGDDHSVGPKNKGLKVRKALRQALAMENFSEISQEIEEDLKRRSGFMRKIVINSDYGGFGLSDDAIRKYLMRKHGAYKEEGPDKYGFSHFYVYGNAFQAHDVCRDDSILIEVIEEMGEKASGKYASLKIVEVPDDVNWYIEEQDGREWVAERHRTWE